jgi:hypothetical protein
MKAEILKQWIDALRSGEYKQGRYALERWPNAKIESGEVVPIEPITDLEKATPTVCYCYQGVLCDLARKAGIDMRAIPYEKPWLKGDKEPTREVVTLFGKTQTRGALPREIFDWAGIPLAGGQYALLRRLELDNDEGMSFQDIALILEKQMPTQ